MKSYAYVYRLWESNGLITFDIGCWDHDGDIDISNLILSKIVSCDGVRGSKSSRIPMFIDFGNQMG